jgi:uncharacterized membrane protein YbhN (UPF0104 family)
MKMIKILQLATVIQFVLIICAGMYIVFFVPERIGEYSQFVGTIFPIFLTEVIPALIGTPLKEAVQRIKNNSQVKE